MRVFVFAALAILLIASCNSNDKSPDFVTFKTIPEGNVIQRDEESFLSENYAGAMEGKFPGLDSLLTFRQIYFKEKNKFDIARYRSFWDEFRNETMNRDLSREEVRLWIDLTGFLFQLTAEAQIAEELERVAWQYFYSNQDVLSDSLIMPYVFTRHTDYIHVNLFVPALIEFNHSLGGQVTVEQKTDFPYSGKILIIFGMETKQYIELYVRIPSWAEQAEVKVKGVKYLAQPGSYSQIAKKWKEGDQVEVIIPIENLPGYITPGQ